MKKQLFFLISILTLTACGPHPNKTELAQVEQMKTTLDSLDLILQSIDLERAVANNVKVQEDADALKMYVSNYPDAFEKKLGVLIDELKIAKKVFSNIEKNHPVLKSEMVYSQNQLKQLKTDLKNDVLQEKLKAEYLQLEMAAVKELSKKIGMLKQNEKIGVVKYEAQIELIENYKKRQN